MSAPHPLCPPSPALRRHCAGGYAVPRRVRRHVRAVRHTGCCAADRTIRRYAKRAHFRALRPSIPSARGIHFAALRRITYRGIVRQQQGSRPKEFPHEAREPNSSGAEPPPTTDISEALPRRPIIPPAPARLRPSPHPPSRPVTPAVVLRLGSRRQAPPGALSLRSFAGGLPPAAQPARWPRASSPLRRLRPPDPRLESG